MLGSCLTLLLLPPCAPGYSKDGYDAYGYDKYGYGKEGESLLPLVVLHVCLAN
jgi:hypothetical protein